MLGVKPVAAPLFTPRALSWERTWALELEVRLKCSSYLTVNNLRIQHKHQPVNDVILNVMRDTKHLSQSGCRRDTPAAMTLSFCPLLHGVQTCCGIHKMAA
jgi:hypothetical protein